MSEFDSRFRYSRLSLHLLLGVISVFLLASSPVSAATNDEPTAVSLKWARNGIGEPSMFRYEDSIVLYFKGSTIVSFDENTGTELWRSHIEYESESIESWRFRNWLYVNSGHRLYRINLDNGAVQDLEFATSASISLYPDDSGVLYVKGAMLDYKKTVMAIDMDTFQTIWTYQPSEDSVTRLAVSPNTILLILASGQLVALDAADGHTRWTTAIESGGALSANKSTAFVMRESLLYAFDIATGNLDWQMDFAPHVCQNSSEHCFLSSLTLRSDDTNVYIAVDGNGPNDLLIATYFVAVDVTSGLVRWESNIVSDGRSLLLIVLPDSEVIPLTVPGTSYHLPARTQLQWQNTPNGIGLSFSEGPQPLSWKSLNLVSAADGQKLELEKVLKPAPNLTTYSQEMGLLSAWGGTTPQQTIDNAQAIANDGDKASALLIFHALYQVDPGAFEQGNGREKLEQFLQAWLNEVETQVHNREDTTKIVWLQEFEHAWALDSSEPPVINTLTRLHLEAYMDRFFYLASLNYWQVAAESKQLTGLRRYSDRYGPDQLKHLDPDNIWEPDIRQKAISVLYVKWLSFVVTPPVIAAFYFIILALHRRDRHYVAFVLISAIVSTLISWLAMSPYIWVGVSQSLLESQIRFCLIGPCGGDTLVLYLQCWSCVQLPLFVGVIPFGISKVAAKVNMASEIRLGTILLCWLNAAILLVRFAIAVQS